MFDTVVMGGNNFGLVGTRATAPRILGSLADMTSDEACLLAETRDMHASEDPNHLAYHELNRERGRLPGALRIRVRFKQHMMPWLDYLMVSPEEMHDVVEPTPWSVDEIVDPNDLDTSGQYYAVLRKA